jgi:hypothetical protein
MLPAPLMRLCHLGNVFVADLSHGPGFCLSREPFCRRTRRGLSGAALLCDQVNSLPASRGYLSRALTGSRQGFPGGTLYYAVTLDRLSIGIPLRLALHPMDNSPAPRVLAGDTQTQAPRMLSDHDAARLGRLQCVHTFARKVLHVREMRPVAIVLPLGHSPGIQNAATAGNSGEARR